MKYEVPTQIWNQLKPYISAAMMSPRKLPSVSRSKMEQYTATRRSSIHNAGNKRRARLTQNCFRLMRPSRSDSAISNEVMRNPLMTKNTSTPRKPPPSHFLLA